MILHSPENHALLSLQTEDQKEFMRDVERRKNMSGDLNFKWDDLCREGIDQSFPAAVCFEWEGEGELQLSEHENFSALLHTFPTEKGGMAENLKADTDYFWRVKNGSETGEVRTFRTADEAPRFLHIDGNTNCRDIGGWKTVDGRTVRQGLIYRTSEFDTHIEMTEEGYRALRDDLHMKTDIDQRGEAVGVVTEAPLGRIGTAWKLLPMTPYESIFEEGDNQKSIAEIFRILADANNYPACFHCWGGADRGGTLAFLLEAVLGLSLEDCMTDYEVTSLAVWSIRTRNYEPFANMVDRLLHFTPETTTIQQGVIAYLLSIGVEREVLDAIQKNLLA